MALFRYEAVDKAGKVVRGAMNAPDEQAVARNLLSMGYSLKSIMNPTLSGVQAAVAAPAAPRQSVQPVRQPGLAVSVAPIVPLRALMRFYRQLAVLVRSGMTVGQALVELEGSTHNQKLRQAARGLAQSVQSGESLSSAMARSPKLFPVHTVGLIWAGELGGFLDKSLDEAATDMEAEGKDSMWASIGWFVANINIVSLILMLPMLDMGGFFARVSSNVKVGGGDIPSVAVGDAVQAVLNEYMKGFWTMVVPVLVGWLVIYIVWKKLKRVPSVRRTLDGLLLMTPVWGNLHRERARERFLKTLHEGYNAGVAPAMAWAAASMSVRNSEIAYRLRGLDDMLRRSDGNLQAALVQSKVFSWEDSNMVGSGERAGAVPDMLSRLSSYHGDSAGKAKIFGRLVAVHALLLGLIAASGYLIIKMVASFYKVGMGIAGGMGL